MTQVLDEIHKRKLIKMVTPIKAYITFDTMEGKERAVKYFAKTSNLGYKN